MTPSWRELSNRLIKLIESWGGPRCYRDGRLHVQYMVSGHVVVTLGTESIRGYMIETCAAYEHTADEAKKKTARFLDVLENVVIEKEDKASGNPVQVLFWRPNEKPRLGEDVLTGVEVKERDARLLDEDRKGFV